VKEVKVHTAVTHVCNHCGGRCLAIEEMVRPKDAGGEKKPFWSKLPKGFAYPLRGEGLYILLVGTIVFSIAEAIATFMAFAFIVGGIIAGFLCKYYVKVIRLSARGGETPPSWGEIDSADIGDFFVQFLRTGAVAVFCAAPAAAYFFFLNDWAADGLFWGLVGLGVFCYPMALLAVSYYEDLFEINPLSLFGAIRRTFGRYVAIFSVLAICIALSGVLLVAMNVVLEEIDVRLFYIAGHFLHRFVSLYFYTTVMHLLGVFVYANKQRLGWV
jgi:hypothetical protein